MCKTGVATVLDLSQELASEPAKQNKIVQGLEIDAFSQECIDKTLKELTDEQAGVAHLL